MSALFARLYYTQIYQFSYTKFQQTLIMPDNADTTNIDAKVCDGVLCINIPKKATSKETKVNRIVEIK